jgi:arsenite/tail-anchored protein-transporting ATPase
MRIILYTGKGGVGKTSVAAATALRCADLGYRTIVTSTDAAHSLGDSFDLPLGNEPTQITQNLWGQEIDVLYQMDRYWGTVQEWLTNLLMWRGAQDVIASEASVLPGMEELASLLQITYLYDSSKYDVIIVDCAPTGETLRFLSFPEVAHWYLAQIFPIQRRLSQIVSPVLRAVVDIPTPDEKVFESIKNLMLQLDRMNSLLIDSQLSSVRIVLNPEKMVVKEAQRTFTYLNLYGFATDLIISNRIIPMDIQDHYFNAWKDIQTKYSQLIEEAFSPLPIFKAPLFDTEVVGIEILRRMAEAIYGDRDPTQHFYDGKTQIIEKLDGDYNLKLPLPFASKEQIHLSRYRDELVISIGNFRRNLILPHSLVGLEVKRARMDGQTLAVTFSRDQKETSG